VGARSASTSSLPDLEDARPRGVEPILIGRRQERLSE